MTSAASAPDVAARPSRGAWWAFVAALAVYLASMSPGVWWGDSAEMSRHALCLDLSPAARDYPLHALLCFAAGKLVGDAALGANFVSALCGAVTVGLLYEVARRLARSPFAGAAAAATLAVAHTFWSYAVVAEVYTLHTALVLGATLAATRLCAGTVRARVVMGALLAVAGLWHHRMTVFAVPAFVYWAWTATPRSERLRAIGHVMLGVLLGTLPFVALCAVASRHAPAGTANVASWWFDYVFLGGEQNTSYMFDAGKKTLVESAAYLAKWVLFNLPGPALAAAAVGFVVAARREGGRVAIFLALLVVANLWFPLRYDWTGDQYTFLVPIYPFLAIAAGIGVAALADRRGPRAGVAACAVLAVTPVVVYVTLAVTPLGERIAPSLDAAARRALFLPIRRGLPRPVDVCAEKLARIPAGALLHCDWGDGEVYLYLQETRGLAHDVDVRIWFREIREETGRDQWVSVGPYAAGIPRPLLPFVPRLRPAGVGLFRLAAR